MASTRINTQRRRSERVSQPLPLIVRGVDLLGQPFEERTSTLTLNLHGCRYASKHHLPKNTWVTLELPQTHDRRNVRARVAWIQRPHSIRELFQIAVELESPSNIWGLESVPGDWTEPRFAGLPGESASPSQESAVSFEADAVSPAIASFMGKLMTEISNPSAAAAAETPLALDFTPASDSPLLHELRAGLERHGRQVVEGAAAEVQEQIRRAAEESRQKQASGLDESLGRLRTEFEQLHRDSRDEFERVQNAARQEFSAGLGVLKNEFVAALKSEFEQHLANIREAAGGSAGDLDRAAQSLRAESEAAQEAAKRLNQARLEIEAAESARSAKPSDGLRADAVVPDAAGADWRSRLESETKVAQGQWEELLQSSLDAGALRLAERLTERSEEILRSSELKMNERITELRGPLVEVSESAREGAAAIKAQLEQEVSRAWASLAEIEHAAGRLKEYSTQLEAASQDTINDLHRRLAAVLDARTAELNHRADALAAAFSQRARPSLDSLGREFVDRTVTEVEAKLRPHVDRIPDLLRELSAREAQAEESLRLHRERLRQVSGQHAREIASQMAATLADLRTSFEGARKEAIVKWNEELDAGGVRASHAAAENIGHTSEWFQQETRARLQVLVEQALAGAANTFELQTTEAGKKLEAQLASQTSAHLAEIERQVDVVAGQVAGRTRSQIEEAAAAAAASFGQVLREISGDETRRFADSTRAVGASRSQEFESAARELLRSLEMTAASSMESFQGQMAAHVETRIGEARQAFGAEFSSAMAAYHAERDARQQEWCASLEQMSAELADAHRERLESAGDHWVVSSVRRLNEHGQDAVESLLRLADQAIRDSFVRIFAGLSESLRDRPSNVASVPGFAPPGAAREITESAPAPHAGAASNNPSA